jgi:hypothetical protein
MDRLAHVAKMSIGTRVYVVGLNKKKDRSQKYWHMPHLVKVLL